jgi:hypothetical protein
MYMPGLPLTAACDGDAKKMCNAGGRGSPFHGTASGVALMAVRA